MTAPHLINPINPQHISGVPPDHRSTSVSPSQPKTKKRKSSVIDQTPNATDTQYVSALGEPPGTSGMARGSEVSPSQPPVKRMRMTSDRLIGKHKIGVPQPSTRTNTTPYMARPAGKLIKTRQKNPVDFNQMWQDLDLQRSGEGLVFIRDVSLDQMEPLFMRYLLGYPFSAEVSTRTKMHRVYVNQAARNAVRRKFSPEVRELYPGDAPDEYSVKGIRCVYCDDHVDDKIARAKLHFKSHVEVANRPTDFEMFKFTLITQLMQYAAKACKYNKFPCNRCGLLGNRNPNAERIHKRVCASRLEVIIAIHKLADIFVSPYTKQLLLELAYMAYHRATIEKIRDEQVSDDDDEME